MASTAPLTDAAAPAPVRNTGTSTIEAAIAAMKAGKFVVVMDNEDRENEGDLIMAAEFATEEAVAFMLRCTTGIICVPALAARIDALQLPLMVADNTEVHKCKFTVTVDLKAGNSTGVSAADRARTIRALADPTVTDPRAFNRPGHIFPLLAMDGGVVVRAGHTEAATDLARLAGAAPVGFICEMNDDNGRMMRRPDLEVFAATHDLPLITISDLIRYRSRTEKLVTRIAPDSNVHQSIQTPHGTFQAVAYTSTIGATQSFEALVYGNVDGASDVPVYFSDDAGLRTSVYAQWAQQHVATHDAGVIIYVNNARALRDVSGDLMARQSIFGVGMQIARDLGVASVQLLTTDDVHFDLRGFGVDVTGVQQLAVPTALL